MRLLSVAKNIGKFNVYVNYFFPICFSPSYAVSVCDGWISFQLDPQFLHEALKKPATPDEARKILGLKGITQVNY
jgi:hypothetical protein